MVNIKILYDGDGNCLPDLETISLSKKNIKDDTACFIAFGLYNNTTVKKLDLSFNNITDHGAVAISDCLKCNNTLKELNLSHNHISFNRMIDLSGYASLYYVNLSEIMHPHGVYIVMSLNIVVLIS